MILVFGSLNADLVFAVARLPRPGETQLAEAYRVLPGGKGANQAVAAARAGANVHLAGAVGDDAFGSLLRSALAESGVDTRLVATVAAPTGCAAVGVDPSGENAILVASGANGSARAAQIPDTMLGPDTIMLLQGEVPIAESAALARRAKRAGARVVLNLAPAREVPSALLASLDVLVVNAQEAASLLGQLQPAHADGTALARRFGTTVIVTRGRDGAVAHLPAGGGFRIGVLPITPIDTTGAGDAFVGILAAALDQRRPLAAALRRASAGAGLACLRAGAQAALPTAAEIESRLAELPAAEKLDDEG